MTERPTPTVTDAEVERVARALHAHEDSWNDVAWEYLPAGTQELFRAQARAAISAMTRSDDGLRSAWQDIETAPKDGTEVLVCVTYSGPDGDDHWVTSQWVDWAKEPYIWPHYRDRIDIPFPPTHWQPLPAPPTLTKGIDHAEG